MNNLEMIISLMGIMTMENESAHKSWWQIFEVVFGLPFAISLALQWLAPLSFGDFFSESILFVGGIGLICIGVTLVFLARREFRKNMQPTDPGQPTIRLIKGSVFSFSRNPLYLGGITTLAGIAFLFNLPWVLFMLIPSLIFCHFILILPEEKYLAARFGDEYAVYMAHVFRWIGRK